MGQTSLFVFALTVASPSTSSLAGAGGTVVETERRNGSDLISSHLQIWCQALVIAAEAGSGT